MGGTIYGYGKILNRVDVISCILVLFNGRFETFIWPQIAYWFKYQFRAIFNKKKHTHCLFKLEDLFILACDCNLSQMNSFNVIKSVTIVKKDNCCLAMYSPISFIHLPLCKNHLDTRSVSQSCIMLFATYVAGFGKTLLLRGAPHLGEHFMINDINITTICHPSLKAMVLKSQVA